MDEDRREKKRAPTFEDVLNVGLKELLEPVTPPPALPPLAPASEMSPREAVDALWRRPGLIFEYQSYKEYFERWWCSLEPGQQNWLNVNVERFASYKDWLDTWLAPARMLDGEQFRDPIEARARLICKDLPHVSVEDIQQALKDRKRASALRDSYVRAAKLIRRHTGLDEGRPVENADRDRRWSEFDYEGLSEKEILGKYNEERTSHYRCSDSAIRKAIAAHRKRNLSLHWALRVSMFIVGIPAQPASGKPKRHRK
jgi:hypothetical protein